MVPMFPIDLQDSPDVLIAMVKHKIVTNKTAVMGQKKQRKEPFVLRSLRNIFYYLLQKCSRRPINRNMGEFGVVDFLGNKGNSEKRTLSIYKINDLVDYIGHLFV